MIRCALATCENLPLLDPDDHLLVRALEARGVEVAPAIWNDSAFNWNDASVCVVRSTWDYHKNPRDFESWVEFVHAHTLLLNPRDVLRWNSHKFYMRDLERAGIDIVPTRWLTRGSATDLGALLASEGWNEAVIKPAYGASADGVSHIGASATQRWAGQRHLDALLAKEDVLLQPFVSTIGENPERALVFIDGSYSHAVTKQPFMHAASDHGLRAGLPPGASGERPVVATAGEIAAAERALAASPPGSVYARVDLVHHAGAIKVLEVELIEPTLYIFAKPASAERLADAILARVS